MIDLSNASKVHTLVANGTAFVSVTTNSQHWKSHFGTLWKLLNGRDLASCHWITRKRHQTRLKQYPQPYIRIMASPSQVPFKDLHCLTAISNICLERAGVGAKMLQKT